MSQTRRIGTTATTIAGDGRHTVVTYHATPVVKFNEREIILNSGGWHTATTKLRMNQTANQFNLGFSVVQRKFDWYVVTKAGEFDFSSGMSINRVTGEVAN